jgi:NAD(P)-dependent dehydrogenase (short-subunit alcohol dehydrogenase family)
VLPGTVDTEANRLAAPAADHSLWTPPEQIARVIAFLASSGSTAINGAAIPVHGRS